MQGPVGLRSACYLTSVVLLVLVVEGADFGKEEGAVMVAVGVGETVGETVGWGLAGT